MAVNLRTMFFRNPEDGKPPHPARSARKAIPLLPLRDIIVFPHMVGQLFVGRERSIDALDEAMAAGKEIFLAAQKNAKTNEPTPEDIFTVGTVGIIKQLLRLPDGTVKVIVEGRSARPRSSYVQTDEFFLVEVEEIAETARAGVEVEALMRSVQAAFEIYVKLNKKVQPEMLDGRADDRRSRAPRDAIVAAPADLKLADSQALLETDAPSSASSASTSSCRPRSRSCRSRRRSAPASRSRWRRRRRSTTSTSRCRRSRRSWAESDEFKNEIQELEEQLKTKRMSKEATAKVKKELKKLKMMHPTSAEATVVRNYIDWILGLPWDDKSDESFDLIDAETILDEDHYGLKKIKERILEYLAVQALTKKLKGPILCLVGPARRRQDEPREVASRAARGASSCASSLGGVRDEAEIRGHRRTYIGALPGKIIQSLKKAGTNNPVFLLDEVDKMSTDFRGDPSAALLEVLDPEQNHTFNDHYLDLDYDLSDVMFITTANTLQRHPRAAAGPHGDHPALRLHRVREAQHRREVPRPEAAEGVRDRRGADDDHRERGPDGDPPLHERGRRPLARARDLRRSAARLRAQVVSRGQGADAAPIEVDGKTSPSTWASPSSARRRRRSRTRSGSRTASP